MTDLNNPGCKFKVGETVQFSAHGLYVVTAVLPKRTMDRLIAKRFGLMPPAT